MVKTSIIMGDNSIFNTYNFLVNRNHHQKYQIKCYAINPKPTRSSRLNHFQLPHNKKYKNYEIIKNLDKADSQIGTTILSTNPEIIWRKGRRINTNYLNKENVKKPIIENTNAILMSEMSKIAIVSKNVSDFINSRNKYLNEKDVEKPIIEEAILVSKRRRLQKKITDYIDSKSDRDSLLNNLSNYHNGSYRNVNNIFGQSTNYQGLISNPDCCKNLIGYYLKTPVSRFDVLIIKRILKSQHKVVYFTKSEIRVNEIFKLGGLKAYNALDPSYLSAIKKRRQAEQQKFEEFYYKKQKGSSGYKIYDLRRGCHRNLNLYQSPNDKIKFSKTISKYSRLYHQRNLNILFRERLYQILTWLKIWFGFKLNKKLKYVKFLEKFDDYSEMNFNIEFKNESLLNLRDQSAMSSTFNLTFLNFDIKDFSSLNIQQVTTDYDIQLKLSDFRVAHESRYKANKTYRQFWNLVCNIRNLTSKVVNNLKPISLDQKWLKLISQMQQPHLYAHILRLYIQDPEHYFRFLNLSLSELNEKLLAFLKTEKKLLFLVTLRKSSRTTLVMNKFGKKFMTSTSLNPIINRDYKILLRKPKYYSVIPINNILIDKVVKNTGNFPNTTKILIKDQNLKRLSEHKKIKVKKLFPHVVEVWLETLPKWNKLNKLITLKFYAQKTLSFFPNISFETRQKIIKHAQDIKKFQDPFFRQFSKILFLIDIDNISYERKFGGQNWQIVENPIDKFGVSFWKPKPLNPFKGFIFMVNLNPGNQSLLNNPISNLTNPHILFNRGLFNMGISYIKMPTEKIIAFLRHAFHSENRSSFFPFVKLSYLEGKRTKKFTFVFQPDKDSNLIPEIEFYLGSRVLITDVDFYNPKIDTRWDNKSSLESLDIFINFIKRQKSGVCFMVGKNFVPKDNLTNMSLSDVTKTDISNNFDYLGTKSHYDHNLYKFKGYGGKTSSNKKLITTIDWKEANIKQKPKNRKVLNQKSNDSLKQNITSDYKIQSRKIPSAKKHLPFSHPNYPGLKVVAPKQIYLKKVSHEKQGGSWAQSAQLKTLNLINLINCLTFQELHKIFESQIQKDLHIHTFSLTNSLNTIWNYKISKNKRSFIKWVKTNGKLQTGTIKLGLNLLVSKAPYLVTNNIHDIDTKQHHSKVCQKPLIKSQQIEFTTKTFQSSEVQLPLLGYKAKLKTSQLFETSTTKPEVPNYSGFIKYKKVKPHSRNKQNYSELYRSNYSQIEDKEILVKTTRSTLSRAVTNYSNELGKINLNTQYETFFASCQNNKIPHSRSDVLTKFIDSSLIDETSTQTMLSPSFPNLISVGDLCKRENFIRGVRFNYDPKKHFYRLPYTGQLELILPTKLVFHNARLYQTNLTLKSLFKRNNLLQPNVCLDITSSTQRITGDIVQGLPKIEELFEARQTRSSHVIRNNPPLLLKEAWNIKREMTRGFEFRLLTEMQQLVVDRLQIAYRGQGVCLDDRNFEVIVRQMSSQVLVEDGDSSGLLNGEWIHREKARMFRKVKIEPRLIGITRAALNAEGILSAASFQETKRVLKQVFLRTTSDRFRGFKEKVIGSTLLSSGTGIFDGGNDSLPWSNDPIDLFKLPISMELSPQKSTFQTINLIEFYNQKESQAKQKLDTQPKFQQLIDKFFNNTYSEQFYRKLFLFICLKLRLPEVQNYFLKWLLIDENATQVTSLGSNHMKQSFYFVYHLINLTQQITGCYNPNKPNIQKGYQGNLSVQDKRINLGDSSLFTLADSTLPTIQTTCDLDNRKSQMGFIFLNDFLNLFLHEEASIRNINTKNPPKFSFVDFLIFRLNSLQEETILEARHKIKLSKSYSRILKPLKKKIKVRSKSRANFESKRLILIIKILKLKSTNYIDEPALRSITNVSIENVYNKLITINDSKSNSVSRLLEMMANNFSDDIKPIQVDGHATNLIHQQKLLLSKQKDISSNADHRMKLTRRNPWLDKRKNNLNLEQIKNKHYPQKIEPLMEGFEAQSLAQLLVDSFSKPHDFTAPAAQNKFQAFLVKFLNNYLSSRFYLIGKKFHLIDKYLSIRADNYQNFFKLIHILKLELLRLSTQKMNSIVSTKKMKGVAFGLVTQNTDKVIKEGCLSVLSNQLQDPSANILDKIIQKDRKYQVLDSVPIVSQINQQLLRHLFKTLGKELSSLYYFERILYTLQSNVPITQDKQNDSEAIDYINEKTYSNIELRIENTIQKILGTVIPRGWPTNARPSLVNKMKRDLHWRSDAHNHKLFFNPTLSFKAYTDPYYYVHIHKKEALDPCYILLMQQAHKFYDYVFLTKSQNAIKLLKYHGLFINQIQQLKRHRLNKIKVLFFIPKHKSLKNELKIISSDKKLESGQSPIFISPIMSTTKDKLKLDYLFEPNNGVINQNLWWDFYMNFSPKTLNQGCVQLTQLTTNKNIFLSNLFYLEQKIESSLNSNKLIIEIGKRTPQNPFLIKTNQVNQFGYLEKFNKPLSIDFEHQKFMLILKLTKKLYLSRNIILSILKETNLYSYDQLSSIINIIKFIPTSNRHEILGTLFNGNKNLSTQINKFYTLNKLFYHQFISRTHIDSLQKTNQALLTTIIAKEYWTSTKEREQKEQRKVKLKESLDFIKFLSGSKSCFYLALYKKQKCLFFEEKLLENRLTGVMYPYNRKLQAILTKSGRHILLIPNTQLSPSINNVIINQYLQIAGQKSLFKQVDSYLFHFYNKLKCLPMQSQIDSNPYWGTIHMLNDKDFRDQNFVINLIKPSTPIDTKKN